MLDLLTEVCSVDMGRFEAEVALRLVCPTTSRVRIKRIGHIACALYGTKTAVQSPVVTWPDEMNHLPASKYIASEGMPIAYRANSLVMHQAGAVSGFARAVLPRFMGNADKRLTQLGKPIIQVGQDIWLVINEDLAGSAWVRAVADFLSNWSVKKVNL